MLSVGRNLMTQLTPTNSVMIPWIIKSCLSSGCTRVQARKPLIFIILSCCLVLVIIRNVNFWIAVLSENPWVSSGQLELSFCGNFVDNFMDTFLDNFVDNFMNNFVDNFRDNFVDNFKDNFGDNFKTSLGSISGQL